MDTFPQSNLLEMLDDLPNLLRTYKNSISWIDQAPSRTSSPSLTKITETAQTPTRQENINSTYCNLDKDNKVSGGFYKGVTWNVYIDKEKVTSAEESIAKASCNTIDAVLIGGLDYRTDDKGVLTDKTLTEQLKLFKDGYGVNKKVKAFRWNIDTPTVVNFIKSNLNANIVMFSAGCTKAQAIAEIPGINKNKIYIVECFAKDPPTAKIVQNAVAAGVPAKNVYVGTHIGTGLGVVKGATPTGAGISHWGALTQIGKIIA
jgi:hypothetical protein